MTPQPIETAPPGDGWILALVSDPDRADAVRHYPWLLLTRTDEGWSDEDGYPWTATAWLPLPDPQPQPTGWRLATGVIRISYWSGIFSVTNDREGGTQEEGGEYCHSNLSDARARASRWAAAAGLPVIEDDGLPNIEGIDAFARIFGGDRR